MAWRWQPQGGAPLDGSVATDGSAVFIASGDRVYCVNQVDGTQKWRFPAGAGLGYSFHGTPSVSGGVVVAAAENRTIYALNEKTGAILWQYISPVSILDSPVIAKNVVLFQQSGNSIMAINLSDGKPFYTTPIHFQDGVQGDFAVWGNDILVFNGAGALDAINIGSQKLDWRRQTDGVSSDVYPIATRNTIYFVSNDFLIALNGSGSMQFQTSVPDALVSAPAISSHGIVAATRDGTVYRFDVNGKTIKSAPPIALNSPLDARPVALANGQFVVATENGAVNLIDMDKGLIWSYPVRPIGGIQKEAKPADSGNGSFGSSGSGKGAGNGITRGSPDDDVATIVTIQAAGVPVESGSTLLVKGRDGSVIAFDKINGVDLTPPTITMTYPNPGEDVSGRPPFALVFKLADEASGVNPSTIKIMVDGKHPLDYEYNREGVAIVRFSESGKNQVLSDGKHVVTVEASDWLGNAAKQTYYLTINNEIPPDNPVPKNGGPPGKGGFGSAGG